MSPTVFRAKGYRFYFLSNEENRMHVHVTAEDGEAKFWLEPAISLAVNHQFNTVQINDIRGLIEERKDDIKTAWQTHFGKR